MDCKEFEKRLPDFLNQQMDFATLQKFIEHRDQCQSCKEELEIRFLVTEGLQRLEDGDEFDLQSELEQRLNEIRSKLKRHSVFLCAGTVLEFLAILVLIGAILWIIF